MDRPLQKICPECAAIPAVRFGKFIDTIVSFFNGYGQTDPILGQRPEGVPKSWIEQPANKGGTKWADPSNPNGGSYVRERLDGTLTQLKNGHPLDANGNPAPRTNSPEAHFPRDQWTFRP